MKTCPKCGAPMVGRAVRRTGRPYFGCSRYPACKGKLAIERTNSLLGDPEEHTTPQSNSVNGGSDGS